MKRYQYIFIAMLLLGGCIKSNDTTPTQEAGQGSITFAAVTSTGAESADEGEAIYNIPESLIPSEAELSLRITGSYKDNLSGVMTDFDETFDNVEAFNTAEDGSPLVMWSGTYEAEISNGAETSVESVDNACFSSGVYSFSIIKDNFEQEASLTVSLVNSIIRMKFDEYFLSYFNSAELTVTTQSGGEFTFDPFSADIEDYIVFVAPDTELTLHGEATRTSGGSGVVFPQSVIGSAKAGYMNTIVVSAKEVGGLTLNINLNTDIVEIHEDTVELNPLN